MRVLERVRRLLARRPSHAPTAADGTEDEFGWAECWLVGHEPDPTDRKVCMRCGGDPRFG